jgi:hypothetical protein
MSELWEEIENILGFNNPNMKRDRPYTGQLHTDTGIRGSQTISGITFRDLRDCYIRAICLSAGIDNETEYQEALKGEDALLEENVVYRLKGNIDPMAIFQNMTCEVEKLMGIYPNVPKLSLNNNEENSND